MSIISLIFQFTGTQKGNIYKIVKDNLKYEEFLDRNPDVVDNRTLFQRVLKYHHEMKHSILCSTPQGSVKEIDRLIPIHIWLSDNSKAVVSFYNLSDPKGESSFFTTDPQLIKVIQNYLKGFRESSKELTCSQSEIRMNGVKRNELINQILSK
jgi:hypothetical protein